MKKRLASIALAAALSLSSLQAFAASGFSDLNEFHAWAEPQIEEMTTLGIIKGYTDGTFRPDQSITKTEALVLISRAAGYITADYDDFKQASYNRYSEVVAPYNSIYPNEVCYLLYKGILTEGELAAYISAERANSPLLRYEMAELLTKLMRADDSLDLNANTTLNYSDAGEIPHSSSAYVEYVTNAALMQGVYDPEYPDDIFFKPYSSVTRAQMAVLLHRVLDKTAITVDYYSAVGKNSSANSVTYRDEDGTTRVFRLTDDINFIVDGYTTRNVTHVATGAKMAFFYIDSTLSDVEIVNSEENKWDGVETEAMPSDPTEPVEGVITSITMGEDCSVIIDNTEYTLSAASVIYVNHVAATIYDLRVGHTAQLQFANGKVVLLYATNPSENGGDVLTAQGTITKLNVTGRSIYVDVTNSETGVTSEKVIYIETGAAIFNAISGQSIDFLSLEIDNYITATGTLKDGNFYASKIIVR